MDLDIIIPTYNRQASLERALMSILKMSVPDGHSLVVTVADNNSTDTTRQTVDRIALSSQCRLKYVSANKGQGSSFARNAAILATKAELIGFVDDDEELDSKWATVVFEAFSDSGLDYIGGPYVPVWEVEPPAWVNHPNTRAALGAVDHGPVARAYEEGSFDAQVVTGNFVVRRRCLDRVGLFAENLGRVGNRLLGGEDVEMHQRLKSAKFYGLYLPRLVVSHHIPAARLTKRYLRRWAFWTSVSAGLSMLRRPSAVPHWFRLPRWMYGQLLRCPFGWLKSLIGGDAAGRFDQELTIWRFWGVFYGVHLFKSSADLGLRGDTTEVLPTP